MSSKKTATATAEPIQDRPGLDLPERQGPPPPGLEENEQPARPSTFQPFEFTAATFEFQRAIAIAIRAVAARPTHPVLANVLIVVDQSSQQVSLTSFDLSLGLIIRFPATVKEGGIVTVSAKLLNDIIKQIPAEEISLKASISKKKKVGEISSINCQLKAGKSNYKLKGMDPHEFPKLPEVAAEGFTIPALSLIQAPKRVTFACSDNETKQILTGVHFKAIGGRLECCATDGHRLSLASVAVALAEEAEEQEEDQAKKAEGLALTIPQKAVNELCELLAKLGGDEVEGKEPIVTVAYDDAQIRFEARRWVLTSRLLEGVYPNYPELIPRQFANRAGVDRRELVAALNRIAVLVDPKNNYVKMEFLPDEKTLRLAVDSAELGSGLETVEIVMSGEGIRIAFNLSYLLDALRLAETSHVDINMNTPTSPAIFAPREGAICWKCLLMPIQVREL
jgi:DNA polymerase-3 subunit beta